MTTLDTLIDQMIAAKTAYSDQPGIPSIYDVEYIESLKSLIVALSDTPGGFTDVLREVL